MLVNKVYKVAFIVTLLFLAAAKAYANSNGVNWQICGQESINSVCEVEQELKDIYTPITIRYGANGQYFYNVVSGQVQFPCNNTAFGDPIPGVVKTCSYTAQNIFNFNNTWEMHKCSDEGQICHLPANSDNSIWWTFFGDSIQSQSGYYTLHQGSGSFNCDNSYFPWNPIGVQKICASQKEPGSFFGMQFPHENNNHWITCATEGFDSQCQISSDNLVILRYGNYTANNTNWAYRIAKLDSIACNTQQFGNRDPAPGIFKICQYLQIPGQID